MSTRPSLETEELLAQVGWVRALALRVARDAHGADDLAQEALLVALSGSRDRPRSLRGWLSKVVRNLERGKHRSEQRRSRREAAALRPDTSPSTLELVERASMQRKLVGALLELEEPYRTTLLQRFFEERTQREIAERTGVPASTVASRIAEGLKRLRPKLARNGEDDPGEWLPAILPLLRWPKDESLPAAITGAFAVSLQMKLLVGGGLAAGAFFAYRSLQPSPPPIVERAQIAVRADASQPSNLVALPEPERTPGSVTRVEATPAPTAEAVEAVCTRTEFERPAPVQVRGRVIDLAGLPVPTVEVCRVDFPGAPPGYAETKCVTSDGSGNFELEVVLPSILTVRSELYTTVFEGSIFGPSDTDTVVIVTWRIPLAGVVVDEHGVEVEGAVAAIRIPREHLQQPGQSLDSSRPVAPGTRSDERGAFSFDDAADLEGSLLEVSAAGYHPARIPIPAGGDEHLRVVLTRSSSEAATLAGHVLLPDGSPAQGALVSTGWCSVETDGEGRFILDFDHLHGSREAALELLAVRTGFLPATLALPSIEEAEERGWPKDVVLELGGPPLSIRGRVVDEEGAPLAGVEVEALDMTDFGLVKGPIGVNGFMHKTVEELAGGGTTTTDRRGEFELGGLLEHDYRLEAMQRASLLTARTDPIRPGTTGLTIVLDRRSLAQIEGRVVDREGRGLTDVTIAVSRKRRGELAIGRKARTDATGRFTLNDVPPDPPYLRIEGETIVPEIFREIPPEADVRDLELQVGRRCHVQFEWLVWPGRADELRVVGENDAPLVLMNLAGGSVSPRDSIRIGSGLTGVFAISDSATHAILYREGEEVMRVRLHPVPGEVELLRL